MDRRDFLTLVASAGLAEAFQFPGFSQSRISVPAEPGGSAPGTVDCNIISSMMQDYSVSRAFTASDQMEITYVADDGTLNIYSLVFDMQLVLTLNRIYSDSKSLTGWMVQSRQLPQVVPPQPPLVTPAMVIHHVNGAPELLIYRGFGQIQNARLGPDGTFDTNVGAMNTTLSFPLISGLVPAGSRYIPEMQNVLGQNQLALRDALYWGNTYLVTGTALPVAPQPLQRMFPLDSPAPGVFRCIAWETSGDVTYLVMKMDAAGKTFGIAERKVLGHCGGAVCVQQKAPGQAEALLVDPPQIQSITGSWDTNSTSPVQFATPVVSKAPQWKAMTPGTRLEAQCATNPDSGATDLYVFSAAPAQQCPDPESKTLFNLLQNTICMIESAAAGVPPPDLWVTSRPAGADWQSIVPLERGRRMLPIFAGRWDTFALHLPKKGFEIWRHSADGEFDAERIRIPAENTKPVAEATYRVGLTLSMAGVGLGGEEIGITASTTCVGEIDGRHVLLSPQRSTNVTLDSAGSAWITVIPGDDLIAPSLAITGKKLGGALKIDLDKNVRQFLGTLQGGQLAAAVDPETGKKVLPNAADAETVAESIRKLIEQMPASQPPPPSVSGLNIHGNLPLAHSASAAAALGARKFQPRSTGAWILSGKPGALTIAAMSPAQFESNVRSMTAAGIQPMVWYDPRDWPRHIEEGFTMAVEAGKALVRIVIDGIPYIYNFILDTIDHVFDAINWVLDKAGMLAGMTMRWILKALGFFFDWDAICAKKDELKNLLYQRAKPAMLRLGDPAVEFANAVETLDSVKATVVSNLNSFRSQPALKASEQSNFGSLPSWQSLMTGVRDDLLAEAVSLIEKVLNALPDIFPDPGYPDIPELITVMRDSAQTILGLQDRITQMLAGLGSLVMNWMTDPQRFMNSPFDAVIDILVLQIDALFDAVKALLTPLGKILHTLWANPDKVLDWLNRTINIPYFTGYYRGLTDGGNLSVLDLTCLVAAIPAHYLPTRSSNPAAVGSMNGEPMLRRVGATPPFSGDPLHNAALGFMIANCVTTSMSAALLAGLPDEVEGVTKYINYFFTGADICCSVGSALCVTWDTDPQWEAIAASTFVGVGASVLGLAYGAMKVLQPIVRVPLKFNRSLLTGGILVQLLYNVKRTLYAFAVGHYLTSAYDLINMFQNAGVLGIRALKESGTKISPHAAVGYGVLQGAMSGARTVLYDHPWSSAVA